MQVVQYIAADASTALAQIHAELGPGAVVLSVRPLPAQGLARLWPKRGRIEVLVGLPAPGESTGTSSPAFSSDESSPGGDPVSYCLGSRTLAPTPNRWKSVAWLEAMGLLPAYADRLQDQLDELHSRAPGSLEEEWGEVTRALAAAWPPAFPAEDEGLTGCAHVFVGPPGSGKTTVLAKWLTLAVLTQEYTARVWRLDSTIANTAEFLTVHCELLATPVERWWSASVAPTDLRFIDLPGAEADDSQSLGALGDQLTLLGSPQVHLVLNAAYETETLLAQWRAFSVLKPKDLILTHLDEESRRVKLWNLVFGTNCRIRFLSSGQKIPGSFQRAAPELLFPAEIPS